MHRFTLVRLPTATEAAQRVAAAPQTRRFRAGGIDLIDHFKEGLDTPDELVELRALGGDEGERMRGIVEQDGAWHIGALVTLAQLADFGDFGAAFGAVREAAGSAATPGIRNAATLGGNLLQRPRCWYYRHADLECLKKGGGQCFALTGDNRYHAVLGGGPSFIVHPSTLAAALVAHDARVHVLGPKGPRSLAVTELFSPPTVDPTREHTLAAGEIIVTIELPAAGAQQRSTYAAAKEKQSHDWPLVEAAVSLSLATGVVTQVRVVLGHVAPTPWRSREAEGVLEGKPPGEALFAEAARAALWEARPLRDNAYKIPLVQGLLREVLHRVAGVPLPE
jgi:xanthine dehydrogenase YagS FAD-binding subunit